MKHSKVIQSKRYKIWSWIVGIVAILGVVAVSLGVFGMKFLDQAKRVKTLETNALASLTDFSGSMSSKTIADIKNKLSYAQKQTQEANEITHNSLWNFVSKIPYIKEDVQALQGMTEVVNDLVEKPIAGFMDAMNILQSSPLNNGDGVNLRPIIEAQPKLKEANEELQKQVDKYNSLPKPKISEIQSAYIQGEDRLNALATKVDNLSSTFEMLPGFLGSGQSQTYAVMAMTTSEMRSSGGLIGSVGEMTTDNGIIRIGNFQSNTDYLSYGSANHSADMDRVFSQDGPLHMSFDVRDLAVFPNTEDTAKAMQSIWMRTPWGADKPLDGIVLVDPVFVQQLVKIGGDTALPTGQVLTGNNTAEYLLNTVYKEYPGNEQATDTIFGLVAAQVINNMFKNISLGKLAQIGDVMKEMASKRHFSMYVFDENLEKTVQQAGFTASVPNDRNRPAVGIYLTEQNPSKLGWYIKRNALVTASNCDDNGSTTYHVEYTLRNSLQAEEAKQLSDFMAGAENHGVSIEKILFYPPQNGVINNLAISGGSSTGIVEDSIDGKEAFRTTVNILPQQQVVFTFDVTVPQAETRLTIDQTPTGWTDNATEYKGQGCVIGRN